MYGLGPIASYPFASDTLAPTFPSAGASERALIVTPTHFDRATLASGTTPQLALTNLQTMSPASKWRSAASTVQDYITIALSWPVACNVLAVVAPNFTSSCYLRVRGANSAADVTAAPVVDKISLAYPLGRKPWLPNWNVWTVLVRWDNETPLQYWRVDIEDGGNVTYLEAARFMLDRAFQPAINIDFNSPAGWAPADVQVATEWGGTLTDARYRPRTMTLTFSAMTQSNLYQGMMEVQRHAGMSGDIVVTQDPAATDALQQQTVFGVLTSGGNNVPQPMWINGEMAWATSASVREVLF